MQLTRHTDYALRLLIFLAGISERRASIAEVAEAQAISRTHLMKIANGLARAGFLEATRGRGGGIRLAREPRAINIGAVSSKAVSSPAERHGSAKAKPSRGADIRLSGIAFHFRG